VTRVDSFTFEIIMGSNLNPTPGMDPINVTYRCRDLGIALASFSCLRAGPEDPTVHLMRYYDIRCNVY